MMILKEKVLRNAGGRLKLCLIIPLANGAKLQYPVPSEAEAWRLYEHHMQLNATQQRSALPNPYHHAIYP